jgi:Human Cytomegalovirus UL139 protein
MSFLKLNYFVFSAVKCEIEELEKREKEWDTLYDAKRSEMEEFKELHRKFESDTREELQRMEDSVSNVCDPISPHYLANIASYHAFGSTKPSILPFSYLNWYLYP